jgi:cobalt-zinc-cadmium efflux system outer membrane protein
MGPPLLLAWVALTAAPDPAPGCRGALAGEALVRCALAASPEVQAAARGAEALAGRRLAARTILPSNPQVEVTAAARRGLWNGERDVNVYGRLSQELEVAGQRRTRVAVVDAELAGQRRRVDAARREVAAATLRLAFELVAAREQSAMLARIAAASQALVDLAAEGERLGLASGLHADIAAALIVKVRRQRVEADRRLATARALLASMLGQDPAAPDVDVAGELPPLRVDGELPALVEHGLSHRAELDIARAERDAQLRTVEVYRRARVPNPSLVAFAQRDGFNERVLGGGLALPIPLPSPLGRTFAGEIAESRARARQAEAELERVRRQVRAEVVTAHAAVQARRAELELFDPARVARARGHLEGLAQEMAAGRLPIRDAVVLQQSLLELLAAQLEARRALGLATVELARAAGLLPTGEGA